MNIYLIFRTDHVDYDEFDSAVVCAASEQDARKIHPQDKRKVEEWIKDSFRSWTSPDKLQVKLIGAAASDQKEGSVICCSFNAG